MLTIEEIQLAVRKLAPEYPIKQVYLFGSYAEGNATPESDVDVLVEFTIWPVSLFDYCGFQQELSDLLNIKVDMLKSPLSESALTDIMIDRTVNLYG